MGIEADEHLVQAASGEMTYVVQADATDEAAMRQLGVPDVRHAVVAIGQDRRPRSWPQPRCPTSACPTSGPRPRPRTPGSWSVSGAHHVVFPERDMGRRVAHRVTGAMLEYVQFDDSFALVETRVPAALVGRTLLDSGIHGDHGVNVVGVKQPGGSFTQSPTRQRAQPRVSPAGRRRGRQRGALRCARVTSQPIHPSLSQLSRTL